MSSHNRVNPSDYENAQRDEGASSFSPMSIADDVNANLEANVSGTDYQKLEQQKLASISAGIVTKRGDRQSSAMKRRLKLNNKTHDYVALLQQASANFEAQLGGYNTTFKDA